MVAVTCDIDTAAGAKLDELLRRIEREMPERLASETRRAAIYVCQSLRTRTKVAPKRVRASEYRAEPSNLPPRYIHSSNGRLLRRWALTRKVGTPDQYTKHHFVYTNARRSKNGKMVGKSAAAERRELLKLHGGIPRAGLAKKSWGWVMKQIYNGAATVDTIWQRTRGERRDPRQYVKGMFARVTGGAFAEIKNHLDYIMDALKPGALAEAMDAASKQLEHNIRKEMGKMTA